MVWAAFCADSTIGLEFVSSHMNSTDYQTVLNANLLPYLGTAGRGGHIFQQDNTRVHWSQSTKQWFQAMNMTVMDCPSSNPDLNLMENLWGILVCRVYEGGKQYTDVSKLKAVIYITGTFSVSLFSTACVHYCLVVSSKLQVVEEHP